MIPLRPHRLHCMNLKSHMQWELRKAEKGISQNYNKTTQTKTYTESHTFRSTLEAIIKKFVKNNKKKKAIQGEKLKVQKTLKLLEMEKMKTKGAQIRAGKRWIRNRGKNKLFPHLEKCRAAKNNINRLFKRNGEIRTDDSEVIEEI